MVFSSISVVGNALRLRRFEARRVATAGAPPPRPRSAAAGR
jgi:hypothetical protein